METNPLIGESLGKTTTTTVTKKPEQEFYPDAPRQITVPNVDAVG